jgi:hypothetical protein
MAFETTPNSIQLMVGELRDGFLSFSLDLLDLCTLGLN